MLGWRLPGTATSCIMAGHTLALEGSQQVPMALDAHCEVACARINRCCCASGVQGSQCCDSLFLAAPRSSTRSRTTWQIASTAFLCIL